MTAVKLGKYKNCKKRFMRFGLSQGEAELACARYLHQDEEWSVEDDEWEAEIEKKKKTGFEVEEEEEENIEEKIAERQRAIAKWKLWTPAGGKGAGPREIGKRRPVKTTPLSGQLPLFQPWRSIKSEHRLQTKLEKVQTKEEQYLTQEQLQKRAQYAVAIKKRDSGELEIILPALILDQMTEASLKELPASVKKSVKKYQAKEGEKVVQNPETGEYGYWRSGKHGRYFAPLGEPKEGGKRTGEKSGRIPKEEEGLTAEKGPGIGAGIRPEQTAYHKVLTARMAAMKEARTKKGVEEIGVEGIGLRGAGTRGVADPAEERVPRKGGSQFGDRPGGPEDVGTLGSGIETEVQRFENKEVNVAVETEGETIETFVAPRPTHQELVEWLKNKVPILSQPQDVLLNIVLHGEAKVITRDVKRKTTTKELQKFNRFQKGLALKGIRSVGTLIDIVEGKKEISGSKYEYADPGTYDHYLREEATQRILETVRTETPNRPATYRAKKFAEEVERWRDTDEEGNYTYQPKKSSRYRMNKGLYEKDKKAHDEAKAKFEKRDPHGEYIAQLNTPAQPYVPAKEVHLSTEKMPVGRAVQTLEKAHKKYKSYEYEPNKMLPVKEPEAQYEKEGIYTKRRMAPLYHPPPITQSPTPQELREERWTVAERSFQKVKKTKRKEKAEAALREKREAAGR